EEERVEVGAVDGGVAARAVTEARLHVIARRDGVALVAELGDLLADEQVAIETAVRIVAALAAFDERAGMLEDVGPLEVRVAAFAALAVLAAAHECEAPVAVRVVAVAAAHHAFRDLVML